jgi:hypothetical protein
MTKPNPRVLEVKGVFVERKHPTIPSFPHLKNAR